MYESKISRKTLIFDTETSGLRPGNICQLSYLLIEGNKIQGKNHYFKVDYVEPGAENIHGLSVEKLLVLSDEKDFKDKFSLVEADFNRADLLVGHNISFDLNFLISEYQRAGQGFNLKDTFCTMKYFTNICRIEHWNGRGYKWPKLEELTNFLQISHSDIIKVTEEIFSSSDIGYHDARFDTVATYLSYLEGIKRGFIKRGY